LRRSEWIGFNIHDVVAMGVARRAPSAPHFIDTFAPFRADGLDRFDLQISGEHEPWPDGPSRAVEEGPGFRYTREGLCLNSPRVQVTRHGEGFRLSGTVELLEYALPLLDRILVTRGVAMIHAMTVAYRDRGLCMRAWSGAGKTSTMAKLVRMDGFAFMGDDWGFLTREGVVLGRAKPMFIRPHHRPLYPHLFSWPRKPLVPVPFSRSVTRLARLAGPFVGRYPPLARATRRWSPQHMMVMPREALPGAPMSAAAPLAVCLFVERFEGGRRVGPTDGGAPGVHGGAPGGRLSSRIAQGLPDHAPGARRVRPRAGRADSGGEGGGGAGGTGRQANLPAAGPSCAVA
jgi:hypothetical protein